MSTEPVIQALRAALTADPNNHPVRAHLAELLVEAGRPDEALVEATTILTTRPDDLPMLRVAATAAEQVGDPRAAAYRRFLSAFGDGPEPPAPPPQPLRQASVVPDTAEELLRGWDDSDAPDEPELGTIGRPGVTLDDIGGLDDVKARLQSSFLTPMRNPELLVQFGKSLRGGLLLWGPPGCGKTFVAWALAGELGANFYEVGLADVLDMWIGSSERNLKSIFEAARRNKPCVLFFDEIDALGQKRSQLRGHSAMRGVVNQLLAELDGAVSDNDGLFVLAASNHPWDIDSALLRPGRFDRSVLVLPPDRPAREAILAHHLKGRPTDGLDIAAVAKATSGFSGADLALVCEQATETAMAETVSSGTLRPISRRHLQDAAASVRPSIAPWLETAKNYALYGNESGTYDELAAYLRRRKGSR